MWSKIILCVLVGLAFASENPGWNKQYHYVYQVRGRSLASLNQISNDYSGVVFKAQLDVQPRSDGNLGAKISNFQYAPLHGELKEGWETQIPDSQLNYQELPLSEKPFQIVLNNGVIRNVIVDKQLKNWQANMLKSIVSQLQLDIKGTNSIASSINILTQDDASSAVFKTMEETVTGVSETLYDIHPYPEHVLQSQPWVVPHKHLIGQGGEVIEVVRHKNFTHSEQVISYHTNFDGISGYKPGNKIGEFLSRSSLSQAVITGSLQQFTIQSSVTFEEIALNPTQGDEQSGSVNNKFNVTLLHVQQAVDENQFEVDNPVEVGVVYGYNNPYGTDNSPRPAKEFDHGVPFSSAESQSFNPYLRLSRSRSLRGRNFAPDSFEEQDWHQDKPQLSEPPSSPLLPFTVGYDGQSIKKKQNIVETVRRLAEEIAQESSHPKEILRQQTPGKFVVLKNLIQVMNKQEMEQVDNQLQSNPEPWYVYRDAVAEAGTGPSLVIIKQWIQQDKVSNVQAAQIVCTAADSARQPTEEYIKFFGEMIQDENIMSKPSFNESALLCYSTLLRKVYASKDESNGKYPVHSYGSFRTDRGQQYVKKTIIPYLTRELHEAISNGDDQQAHVYILALGKTGQPEALEAFEPYLEGDRKSSQHQRHLMVLSMNALAETHPVTARSVFYKIYQNSGEEEHVRVAAVYQLIRTQPPPSMLQRMAAFTNVDTDHYVNAAVKSVIETASDLEGPEYDYLRASAQSAKPLLTSQEYGAQYSQGYLRGYVSEQSSLRYHQHVETFGSEDHAVPRGIRYMLKKELGGNEQSIVVQYTSSSTEDLINVFQQQTKENQREVNEKRAQNPESKQWTSEYLAKVLNLQNEQREQLEGSFYYRVGALQSIFSFDNHTIENLPKEIQELEQKLRQGQHYKYNKMMIAREMSLAFPTVLGLPFLYNYHEPVFARVEAEFKASAQPQISSGEYLQQPDTVEGDFDINAVLSGRRQSQFGIFTPFDHQRYSAGFHKNIQLVLPVTGKFNLNTRKNQMKVEVQNPGSQETVRLAHYSSWPYTSQNDIYSPKPNLKIIRSDEPYKRNVVVGDKSAGIGFYMQITSDERIDPAAFLYDKLNQRDLLGTILEPWIDENIQYVHVDVGIDASKSSTQQIILRLGYQSDYQPNDPSERKPDPNEQITDIPSFSEDPEKRQQEFVDRLGRYINSANVFAADATVELVGQSKIRYSVTAGAAKSDVDPQGRFMALVQKLKDQTPKTVAYVQAVSKVPNTNGLNLDYAMQMDPTSTVYVQGLLRKDQRLSRAEANIKLSKSQERVQYLKQQEEYKECKQQMAQGDTQLPTCAAATIQANRLDQFDVKMKYNDMDKGIINATYKAYSLLRHFLYPRVEENIVDSQSNDHLDIQGEYSPDLEYVNVTIVSEFGKSKIKDVAVGRWAREFLVPHPVFHTRARLQGLILKEDTFRPICVVDKKHTNTFDNKTYPSSLPNAWTVVLQYVPRRPSPVPNKPDQTVSEQLRQTVESYAVLTRAEQEGSPQKEVQIVLQMPSTQGKVVKIQLKPRQSRQPKVLVNDQEVKYTQQSSSDFYDGYIQIYGLPNEEVKVEVHKAFYVIFNGQTLKLTSVNSKFRDASRGLCGTFDGEPETDFTAPSGCIIHDPQEFINSYSVGPQGQPMRQDSQSEQCYQKRTTYADYISNQDAGRSSDHDRRSGDECTGHLSRYLERDGDICFTIRALPFCKQGCKPLQMNSKQIDVHCLELSANTGFWRSQLDKKIAVDFTMMQQTNKIPMDVPSRCVQN